MPSAPINIPSRGYSGVRAMADSRPSSPSASSTTSDSPSSSPSSPGLYVPVHKRLGSTSSTASSITPDSPISSAVNPYIYTRDTLLALAPSSMTPSSPTPSPSSSSKLNSAMRTLLRETCPEIVMNRKTRKTMEYHQRQLPHHDVQVATFYPTPTPTPLIDVVRPPVAIPNPPLPTTRAPTPRRTRPVGRAPERRRNALKLDSTSWRSRGFGVGGMHGSLNGTVIAV